MRTEDAHVWSLAALVSAVLLWGGSHAIASPPAYADRAPGPAETPSVEIEVYEAVLRSWFGRSHSGVLVDERLGSAPQPSDEEVSDCLKGVDFRSGASPALESLRDAKFKRKGVRLVDGAKWHADDEQLNTAVTHGEFHDADLERAFEHALSRFSQIQFDKDGRLALLTFSYVCGDLCGSGSTLLMKKSANRWTVMKRCRQWVS